MALISISSFAQIKEAFQPVVGINYTGGFTYGMDHELFSGKVGMLYTLGGTGKYKEGKPLISSVELSGNFYYDFFPKTKNSPYTFYNVKVQLGKNFAEWWNVVAYAGYVNNFDNDIMQPYAGEYRTNLSYGIGLQTFDDHIVGEVLFEELAGYAHLSVGITYKFNKIKSKK